MAETTQKERDLLRLGWDRDGPLCRALNDADRLQRAEELLREASFGFHQHKASLLDYCPRCRERVQAIDAFLGESHD